MNPCGPCAIVCTLCIDSHTRSVQAYTAKVTSDAVRLLTRLGWKLTAPESVSDVRPV